MNTVTPKQARSVEKDLILADIFKQGGTVVERGPDHRKAMIVADINGQQNTIHVTISMDDTDHFIIGTDTMKKYLGEDRNVAVHLVKYNNNKADRKFVVRGETLGALAMAEEYGYKLLREERGTPKDGEGSTRHIHLVNLIPFEVAI